MIKYVLVARIMLRDVTFSQYVSAIPDEVDEYHPTAQGSHKRTVITGSSTSAADARPNTQGKT
jgi:hypothetical protein